MRADVKAIRAELDELIEKVDNIAGYRKEIDHALDRIAELSSALDAECERIGRDPASIRRSVEGVLAIAPPGKLADALTGARRRYGQPGFGLEAGGFAGPPAQVADRIAELAEAGGVTY